MNNMYVYVSFVICFMQFSYFIYSYVMGICNYCRQCVFGYFVDFSNNCLFVLKI